MESILLQLCVPDNNTIQQVCRFSSRRYARRFYHSSAEKHVFCFVPIDSTICPFQISSNHSIFISVFWVGRIGISLDRLAVPFAKPVVFQRWLSMLIINYCVLQLTIKVSPAIAIENDTVYFYLWHLYDSILLDTFCCTQATAELRKALKNPDNISALCQLVATSTNPQVCNFWWTRVSSIYIVLTSDKYMIESWCLGKAVCSRPS